MDTPNPELMHLYGTDAYYLEKTGALPMAARLLTGLGSLALLRSDQKHREELMAEAALMNRMMREEEARRMEGVAAGFEGRGLQARPAITGPPASGHLDIYPGDPVMSEFETDLTREMERRAHVELDPGLSKLAEGIGRKLARRSAEMEKEAVIGAIRRGASILGGILKRRPIGGGKGFISGKASTTSPWAAAKQGPYRTPAPKPPATGQAAAQAPARPAAPTPTTAAAAPPAAPKAAKKPWLDPSTKAKIFGAGVLGTAGYAGLKGAQATRDFMMIPTQGGGRYGRYGPSPQHQVNRYGYTQPIY